ncbi:MAG: group II intron reverse transcriptase domain-containing protein [Parcubacteria group bacterium]|nr:group II intron reverse transcriptase domain-containing protein [Parcubacteria group bacterium]
MVSLENLLEAWKEFIKGKRKRKDVQEFQLNLMDNILSLHHDLTNHIYKHGEYQAFNISDPKPRSIHKAKVRDRLLHHAIYRQLYPFFDKTFIADSYSSRLNKGTHKAINRFRDFSYKESKNNTKTVWVLKCDIKKFFANIDHQVLLAILKKYISNPNIIELLNEIISSFYLIHLGIGLPLGNLTSQLLVNIYMNEFDQFVKHKLKVKYYIRYADDFVFLSQNKNWLLDLLPQVSSFLQNRLGLQLHPHKVSIKTLNSGIDFLGWVHFSDHRVLRTATKRRMLKRVEINKSIETIKLKLKIIHSRLCFKHCFYIQNLVKLKGNNDSK